MCRSEISTPSRSRLWYPPSSMFTCPSQEPETGPCRHHMSSYDAVELRAEDLILAVAAADKVKELQTKCQSAHRALRTLHAVSPPPDISSINLFVPHGTGQSVFFDADQPSHTPPVVPPPVFAVLPILQRARCQLCTEALLCKDDVTFDDTLGSWVCPSTSFVPFKNGFAHPVCLPQSRICVRAHTEKKGGTHHS